MADYLVKLGLDATEHDRKLKRAEADASRAGKNIARDLQSGLSFAKGVVGHQLLKKAFDAVGRSVSEFAKENTDAQRVLERWEAVGSRVSNAIGREVANLMEGLSSQADGAASLFERAFEGTTNFFADAMKMVAGTYGPGETAADVVAARSGREQLDRHIRGVQQLRREYAELEAAKAGALGDTEGEARIRAKLKRDLALIAIAAGKDDPSVKAQRREIVGQQYQLDTEAIDADKFNRQTEVLQSGIKLQRKLEADVRQFSTRARIDRLGEGGSTEAASFAGRALEYQAKLNEIRRAYSVDDAARGAIEREFLTQGRLSLLSSGNAAIAKLESDLLKAEQLRSYRTFEAGLGGFASNIYGGGGGDSDEVQRIRKDLDDLRGLLRGILENTRSFTAVAGGA